eukprot:m.174938 g.174938  ORF g.174938 m.174938 type:complete len:321 (-) comp13898_c0_seq1:86-1048(-)
MMLMWTSMSSVVVVLLSVASAVSLGVRCLFLASHPRVTQPGLHTPTTYGMFPAAAILVAIHGSTLAWTSFCDGAGYSVVWRDEFSGTTLNTSAWTVDLAGNDSRVRDSQGTADNVYVEDGHLVLRSQREAVNGYEFTSGAVETQGKVSWKGPARACVSAALPGGGGGNGIWPAHWMMPEDSSCWPSHGEIDIMEMVNGDGILHSTYHWQPNGWCGDKPEKHPSISGQINIGPDWSSAFHEYAVEYGPDHIYYALDGVIFERITTSNTSKANGDHAMFFDTPYYMILNTAVGGPWPKPVDNSTMLPTYHKIDYVRVAQPSS